MTPNFVRFRNLVVGVVALMLDCWSVHAQGPPRRALLLYPYDNEHPFTQSAGAAIRKRLVEKSPSKIDIYSDFLDIDRFADDADEARAARYLAEKHAREPPEIILPLGTEAYRFAIKYRETFAPGVPIVFAASRPNWLRPRIGPETPPVTTANLTRAKL